MEQVGVTCAFVRVKGIRFHYFGGFQKTSAQFSRSSKSLFQNSKLPIAPMFLQIFQYLWFLLQIPENLQNLIWRQVHAGAVVFNDLVLCRVG